MYIEDLIISLISSSAVTINPFDSKLLTSFQDQIFRGSGFTEKQENLAIKILKRHQHKLTLILNKNIDQDLENPKFRMTRRFINSSKTMKIVPHSEYGKAIKVEFPFNEALLTKIRSGKSKINYGNWNPDEKSWIFSLDERSLQFLIPISNEFNFSVDDEFENYKEQIKDIESNIEKYVPLVAYSQGKLEFLNIPSSLPQPENSNILENIFLARKLGIFTWDAEIEETDEWKTAPSLVKKFLKADPGAEFSINLEETNLETLSDIVKFLSPTLFVIPGGTELEKLEISVNFLKNIGIDNEEISVLFRLPKETGENFNVFVKSNKLNNPISKKTKAVFVSSKIPKPVIGSDIKFHSVINFNFYNIHYTIKNYLKRAHNMVLIMEKKQQRSFNFGNM